jgi:transcription elongation factor Elf1
MNHPVSKHESSFSVLLDTRREVAELVAECPICGAMTILPVEIAWQQGIVYCSECGTTMNVTRAVLERLRVQAEAASTTIARLLEAPT